MPGDLGPTFGDDTRVLYHPLHTRLRVWAAHPAFPAPSVFLAHMIHAAPGALRRGIADSHLKLAVLKIEVARLSQWRPRPTCRGEPISLGFYRVFYGALHPTREPIFDFYGAKSGCQRAAFSVCALPNYGASHKEWAVSSQHLLFLSRGRDIYL
jgi:hypothetical protein